MNKLAMISAALMASVARASDEHPQLDMDQAKLSFQFSNAAYCGYKAYETLSYDDLLKGFEWHYTIHEGWHDVEGFIGYLPSDKSIWVAFEGSESIQNWISNIDYFKSKYDVWPECKCKVHGGFEGAANAVADDIVEQLTALVEKYPKAEVKVTGHSLGGALAQLTMMTLLKHGFNVTQMINFGQPRVGDDTYAAFSDNLFQNQWRFVHHKDIVPHVPSEMFPFNFYHTSTEVYEDEDGNYKICEPGEDKTCADQFNFYSISDHLHYMGQCVGSTCGQCHERSEEEPQEVEKIEEPAPAMQIVPSLPSTDEVNLQQ